MPSVNLLRIAVFAMLNGCGALIGTVALGQESPTLVIGNERGGMIGARAIEIVLLNQSNTRVELRGRICFSACTMYLGATNLCIHRQTTFGFHGPSRDGAELPQTQFDHWSEVMAAHYYSPLRDWFLQEARFRTNGVYRVSGKQLISLGYQACDS